jgi:hypothetical protein
MKKDIPGVQELFAEATKLCGKLTSRMEKTMKLTRLALVSVIICAMIFSVLPTEFNTSVYGTETEGFAPGTSLVAADQVAASGGYYFPGLNITWLDFGPDRRLATWGMGGMPAEPAAVESIFTLMLAGNEVGDAVNIAFDETGRIIATGYSRIHDFYEGMAMVEIFGPMVGRGPPPRDYGWIDRNGNEVIPVGKFTPGWSLGGFGIFSEGLAVFSTNIAEPDSYLWEPREGFFDKSGNIVIPAERFIRAGIFSEGRAWVLDATTNKYGFIDRSGEYVIPPQFDRVSNFREGLAYVEKDGKASYIDLKGEVVIPLSSPVTDADHIGFEPRFFNGLAVARGPSGALGFIDKTGAFVIEPMYYDAHPFSREATWVAYSNPFEYYSTSFLIDRQNNRLTPIGYYTMFVADFMHGGIFHVGNRETGRFGILNEYGAEVIPPVLMYISPAKNGYCLVIPSVGDRLIVGILNLDEAIKANKNNKMINVNIDGQLLRILDTDPIIENGRTLAPMRAIFEALGATLDWDETNRTATAVKDDMILTVTIGESTATVNGEPVTLDVPAVIHRQRTLVPVRFIAESFGMEVEWCQETRTVLIK